MMSSASSIGRHPLILGSESFGSESNDFDPTISSLPARPRYSDGRSNDGARIFPDLPDKAGFVPCPRRDLFTAASKNFGGVGDRVAVRRCVDIDRERRGSGVFRQIAVRDPRSVVCTAMRAFHQAFRPRNSPARHELSTRKV